MGQELIQVYRQSACRWLFKLSSDSRLPLLPARPAVTFPVKERHHSLTSTKLYWLVTETHSCEQLAKVLCSFVSVGIEHTIDRSQVNALPLCHSMLWIRHLKINMLTLLHVVQTSQLVSPRWLRFCHPNLPLSKPCHPNGLLPKLPVSQTSFAQLVRRPDDAALYIDTLCNSDTIKFDKLWKSMFVSCRNASCSACNNLFHAKVRAMHVVMLMYNLFRK